MQTDMRIGDVLGLRFLAKVNMIHELTVTQNQITPFPIPILQNQFRHSRTQLTLHIQPDTRLASVNPVILSNTAKLVVDSGCLPTRDIRHRPRVKFLGKGSGGVTEL